MLHARAIIMPNHGSTQLCIMSGSYKYVCMYVCVCMSMHIRVHEAQYNLQSLRLALQCLNFTNCDWI